MKQLVFLFLLSSFASSRAYSQTVLLADTALVTDVGYGGAPASCKSNGMTYNAVNMDEAQHTWLADDFTIPANTSWSFDTVILFGYQYGTGLSSPFTGCHLAIFNGTPGAGGSVVWGDTSTNVLSSTDFTGIYKVDTFAADNGLLSNKRAIMYLKLYLPQAPVLTTGTYWLAWQASCATNVNPAICPYKVLPGRVNPPGQNSRAYTNGSWQSVVDSGNAVGLNMMIKGAATVGVKPVYNQAAENTLSQNVPNPFSNATIISYSLAEQDNVKLAVYNILGQCIATLTDGRMDKGEHKVTFNTGDLPNGAYYYKLSTTEGTISRQMVLVK